MNYSCLVLGAVIASVVCYLVKARKTCRVLIVGGGFEVLLEQTTPFEPICFGNSTGAVTVYARG